MDPERRVVCGIAVVVAVVVASVAFFGWRACGRSVDAVGVDGAAIELKVNLRCDGWSSENTGLGVFVSGTQIDGATCDEQLVFEGSGVQTAYLGAGSYEIVPQLPSLMLRDGTVLAAGDAVARDYGELFRSRRSRDRVRGDRRARPVRGRVARRRRLQLRLRGRCERGVRARFGAEERGGGP